MEHNPAKLQKVKMQQMTPHSANKHTPAKPHTPAKQQLKSRPQSTKRGAPSHSTPARKRQHEEESNDEEEEEDEEEVETRPTSKKQKVNGGSAVKKSSVKQISASEGDSEEDEDDEEMEEGDEDAANHGVLLQDEDDDDDDEDELDADEDGQEDSGDSEDENDDDDGDDDDEADAAADAEVEMELAKLQKQKQQTQQKVKQAASNGSKHSAANGSATKASASAASAAAASAAAAAPAVSKTQPAHDGNSNDDDAEEDGEEKDYSDVTFKSLGVVDTLCEAAGALGWKRPSDIQRESLPYALQGRDIIGLAETGSGKTGAFGLPILQALLQKPQGLFALILSPTRELAFQISEQLEALGSGIGVRCVTIVGGVDMMSQAIALAKKPHIIVASPGRVVDHLQNTKGFNLRQLQYLVLDEADRLLNMDFEKEIDEILQHIPKQRTTFLFSATMTSKVVKLQRASLHNPVKVEVSKKYGTVKQLVQQYLFIPAKYKDVYLVGLLNELAGNTSIIFTSTCEHCQRLAIMLRNLGFGAIPLHGRMSQPKRLGALSTFKSGKRGILIATDVASRGLDIPAVDLVLNYDIPTHSKDYIHRVGRTARAGRSGRAVTFVTQYDVELFQRIEQLIGKKMSAFQLDESQVMVLLERVSEAQRIAAMDLRESEAARKAKKRAGGGADDDDEETETGAAQITAGLGGIVAGGKGGKGGRGGKGNRGRGRR